MPTAFFLNERNCVDVGRPAILQRDLTQRLELISLDEWQDYVSGHPNRTPLHHRKWLELLATHYRYQVLLAAIRVEGQLQAATAFVNVRTITGARKLVSMPFTDCFTPLSDDVDATCELLDSFGKSAKASSVSVRMDRALDQYVYDQCWFRHRIRLTPEMSNLLPLLRSSVRRNIKKAIDAGLESQRLTSMQAVDEFYRLHVLTRKKLGVPVQPRTFFRRLHAIMIESGLGFVDVVRSGGTPVAAAIFIKDDQTTLYKYGASDPAALSLRPNDFLFLNAVQSAAREHQYFDFGVTHVRDEGLCRFKRKWGAEEEEIYDVCIAGKPRGFVGESRAVKLTSVVIRRSPTFLCRALGHVFYRFGV